MRERLANLVPGHRFAALSGAAHVLGSGFNMAAVALLAPMFEREPADGRTGVRMRSAVLWGFGSATCWSPLYVGTAAILSSIPAVSWIEVLPYGLVFGLYLMVAAYLFDRILRRRSTRPATQLAGQGAGIARPALRFDSGTRSSLRHCHGPGGTWRPCADRVDRSRCSGLFVDLAGHDTPPPRAIAYSRDRDRGISRPAANAVRDNFVCLRKHIRIHDGRPRGPRLRRNDRLPGPDTALFLRILIVLLVYLAASALGVHPIVSLVVFTAVADPAALGLPLPCWWQQ